MITCRQLSCITILVSAYSILVSCGGGGGGGGGGATVTPTPSDHERVAASGGRATGADVVHHAIMGEITVPGYSNNGTLIVRHGFFPPAAAAVVPQSVPFSIPTAIGVVLPALPERPLP